MNYPDTELRFQIECDTGEEPLIKLEGLYVHIQGVSQNILISPLSTLAAAHYKFFENTTDVAGSIPLFIGFSNKAIGEFFGIDITKPDFTIPSYPVIDLDSRIYLYELNNVLLNFGYIQSGNLVDNNSMVFLDSVITDLSSDGKLDGLTRIAIDQEYIEVNYPSGFTQQVDSYTYLIDFVKSTTQEISRYITDVNLLSELLNWSVSISETRTSLSRNVEILALDTSQPSVSVMHSALDGELVIRIKGLDDLLVLSVGVEVNGIEYVPQRSYDNNFEISFQLSEVGLEYSDIGNVQVTITDFFGNSSSTIIDMSG